jgi:hypothetical protein
MERIGTVTPFRFRFVVFNSVHGVESFKNLNKEALLTHEIASNF